MPKNTKKCRKAIQKRKKKTTFTPKEKISRVMEEKTFFTAKEREQLFTLYKRLLHLSGDTLQKNDCRKLKTHLIKAVAEGSMPRNNFGMNPIIKDMQTAVIVAEEIGMKRASILGIMLHESVKNHLCSLASVQAEYGEDVAGIIRGLVKINELYAKSPTIESENFRNLLLSFAEDMRVILIMIADRVNLMRQIKDSENEEARQQVSNEAAYLYAPLAHKLGLYKLKSELEDLSLKYTDRKQYDFIKQKLNETKRSRDAYIAEFITPIKSKLEEAGLQFDIKGRTKSIHSINNKLKKQNIPFEHIYDLFAIRIILDCPLEEEKQQCWTVYSIVTDFYTPNPERMRDWISIPKSNGYESLHTTVATKEGRWVEIQIRTERMDAVAERGIAAHWRYKGVNAGSDGSEMWMKQLRELMEDKTRPLAQNFDAKPSSGEIFVFTPGGDLRKLPEGATVLDFAFDIHTSLGLTCSGGKVNNRPAAIRDVLHNGDIVEVLTQKNQKPKADWLGFVTTSKARTRIKASLREEHTKNARLGREELERKLKNWKLPLTVDEGVGILCKHFKLRTGTELYASIGTEKIDLMQIKELLQAHLSGEAEEERRAAAAAIESEKRRKAEKVSTQSSGDALIIDEKIGQLDYKLAKCCNPIHGDEIFGFITVGAGITIHRTDCPNAQRLRRNYPYRVLEARWRDEAQGAFRVSIRVVASDTTGMINHIAEVINRDLKLSIRSMNLSPGGGLLSGVIHVEVPGTGMVDMLIHSILRIKGVQKAYRVNN